MEARIGKLRLASSRLRIAGCVFMLLVASTIGGCSSAGPGFANHPMDCAIGVPWGDCLPGTAGYRGPSQQMIGQAAWQKVNAAIAECRQKRLEKEINGFKASAECSNPKIIAAWQEAQFPYMDLIFVFTAARVVGGENVDKGKITEAELNLELAELNSRIVAEEQRRNLAKSNAQAAQMQATGSLVQGLGALQSAQVVNRPAVLPTPQQRTINCNSIGLGGGMTTTTCM